MRCRPVCEVKVWKFQLIQTLYNSTERHGKKIEEISSLSVPESTSAGHAQYRLRSRAKLFTSSFERMKNSNAGSTRECQRL